MSFEFLGIEPSGNGRDFILKVRRRPSLWGRLWGATTETTAFVGPRPRWGTIDGRPAPARVSRALDALWQQHGQGFEPRGVAAWRGFEPRGDNEHRQMPGRAAALPPDPNRKIAGATGEALRP